MAHILVADDEPKVRDLVRRHLERDGHSVTEAPNGLEAWRQMGYTRFDLLVTDLMMPEIVGEDLVRLMENNNVTAVMPVLIMGNRSPDPEKDEDMSIPVTRSKGVTLLIKKPFNPKQMVEMVRVLLASPVEEVGSGVRTEFLADDI